MTRKMIAVVVAAMAVMLLAGTFDTADARKGGGWRGGGHHSFSRGFRVGRIHRFRGSRFYGGGSYRRHHRRHYRNFYVGVPYLYGVYGYGYGPDCYWLKRKARRTGSRYWWRRYHECRYGYDYYYPY